MDMKGLSRFRLWVQELWMNNKEERLIWGEEPATIEQYWNTYKWWIRREYRHQERKNAKRQTATAL